MLTKIRHMRERNEKIQFYEGHEIDAKWMKICESLIINIVDGVYWDDKYNNKALNIRNMTFRNEVYIQNAYNFHSGFPSEIREMKAKRLLFKILEWRINYWWD